MLYLSSQKVIPVEKLQIASDRLQIRNLREQDLEDFYSNQNLL